MLRSIKSDHVVDKFQPPGVPSPIGGGHGGSMTMQKCVIQNLTITEPKQSSHPTVSPPPLQYLSSSSMQIVLDPQSPSQLPVHPRQKKSEWVRRWRAGIGEPFGRPSIYKNHEIGDVLGVPVVRFSSMNYCMQVV